MRNRPSRQLTSTISAGTGMTGPAATWSTPFGPCGATCLRPIATRSNTRSTRCSTRRRAPVCSASLKSFDPWVRSPGSHRSSRRRSLFITDLLERAAGGARLSFDEGVRLYEEAPLHELGAAAHARRMSLFPTDDVTYVIDTTINYTNVCNVHCTFCAFFRPERHGEGYTMSHDDVVSRVKWAADHGATT